MLLSKEIAVYLNLSACKLKQYTGSALRRAGVDLTPEQFLVVYLLWNQGAMSQQQIADSLGKDKNSVTKLLDALEKKSFVKREPSRTDRRSNTVRLTKKAEALKTEAKETGISMLDRMLEGISEDALRAFLDTLGKMNANMSVKL